MRGSAAVMVASSMSISLGLASSSSREAVVIGSPVRATDRIPATSRTAATTSPVAMPMRSSIGSAPPVTYLASAACICSAERQALRASSS